MYNYIVVSLDDVIAYPPYSTFEFHLFMDILRTNDLAVATPAIQGSSHVVLHPVPLQQIHQVGRRINSFEVQFTFFRADAWSCIWELLDLEFPHGWGIDMWFFDYCLANGRIPNGTIGIIDLQKVVHMTLPSLNTSNNTALIMQRQAESLSLSMNITLATSWDDNFQHFGPLFYDSKQEYHTT